MLLIENGGMLVWMWRPRKASWGENSRRAVVMWMISDSSVIDSLKTEELQQGTLAPPPLSGRSFGLAR